MEPQTLTEYEAEQIVRAMKRKGVWHLAVTGVLVVVAGVAVLSAAFGQEWRDGGWSGVEWNDGWRPEGSSYAPQPPVMLPNPIPGLPSYPVARALWYR